MDVAQIETGHIVAGTASGWPRQPVLHFFGCARAPFDEPGRLCEANHQAAIRHSPRSGPTGKPWRLWRVIDYPLLILDDLEVLVGSSGCDEETRPNGERSAPSGWL